MPAAVEPGRSVALALRSTLIPFPELLRTDIMKRVLLAAAAATIMMIHPASAQRANYESMVASHAAANGVPPELVHRVIVRESKYNPRAVSKGNYGMMQIKLATARGVGYTGTAQGLLDPDTNLRYGVRYLAGAYRTANGHHGRAVSYYASGYYYAAKRQRQQQRPLNLLANARNDAATEMTAAAPAFDTQAPRRKKSRHR